MKKSVLASLLLVVAILGGALLVYERLFADEAPVAAPVPVKKADAAEPSDSRPRDAGQLAEATPDAGPGTAQRATVVSTRGKVEAKDAEGNWRAVTPGQELSADEAVRTGRNGEANLSFGDGIEVRISPLSEFAVRELQQDISRIRLEEGHVAASVDPSKRRALQVEAKGSDAVAESRGGAFGVVSDGRGQLTVATETGSVKLSSRGKTVDVEAGTTSTVNADSDGPTAPRPIPKSLFLKLQEPRTRRTNRAVTTVQGQTDPGSVVRVEGQLASVDSKGRFKVQVKLKDGANRVSVNVLDAGGRKQGARTDEIVLDREKPAIETNMQWGGGGG